MTLSAKLMPMSIFNKTEDVTINPCDCLYVFHDLKLDGITKLQPMILGLILIYESYPKSTAIRSRSL